MFLRLSLLIAAIAMIISCSESKRAVEPKAETVAPKERSLSEIYNMEDYTDPSQWAEPRMQFLAKITAQDEDGIWSSKLDGSDVRLAWSFKVVTDLEDGGTNHAPVRSPNNRYIAIGLSSSAGLSRILVDLETGGWERMDFGGSPPSFTWTADSKNVIFWSEGDVKKFNVETKVLTKLSDDLHGVFIFLLKDQKTLLGVGSNSYSYYNIETGKNLKTVQLGLSRVIKSARISATEQYLHFRYGMGLGFVDLSTDKLFYKAVNNQKSNGDRLFFSGGIFPRLGNTILYWSRGYLLEFNPITEEVIKLTKMELEPFRQTLINKQALLYQGVESSGTKSTH